MAKGKKKNVALLRISMLSAWRAFTCKHTCVCVHLYTYLLMLVHMYLCIIMPTNGEMCVEVLKGITNAQLNQKT